MGNELDQLLFISFHYKKDQLSSGRARVKRVE